MKNRIAQVVIGLPVEGPFDYSVDKDKRKQITVGQRVQVLFNHQKRVGYIVGLKQKSSFKKLNNILLLLENKPALDSRLLKLAKKFSDHYGCSLGEAIETFLPPVLRKGKAITLTDVSEKKLPPRKKTSNTLLISFHNEKTKDYLREQIKKTLDDKKSVIVLVPEVSQIKAMEAVLSEFFKGVMMVYNHKVRVKKELEQWQEIKSGKAKIILGTRSAIFVPAKNLGLIIIANEENGAYRQEQTPHYHVHDVASMRAEIEYCDLLLTSMAPLAETYKQAQSKQWKIVQIKEENLSQLQIIDMTNYNPRRSSILSFPLQSAIQKTLDQNGKTLIFMNRKGFSTSTQCNSCGYQLKCPDCDINLTYSYSKKLMSCHRCTYKMELPKMCPSCHKDYLRSTGMGIEKLESEVARIYPQAKVSHYEKETKMFPSQADIVLATQAILNTPQAMPFDFVAVVNFDVELNRMDFRSGSKAFSLLVHLRLLAQEKFLVQTRLIDNYCLQSIKRWDLKYFYKHELKLRRELKLPPYYHLLSVGLRGAKEEIVDEQSVQLFEKLTTEEMKDIDITEPQPDVIPKLRSKYRYTIILKGKSLENILTLTKKVLKTFRRKSDVIITLNIDP